MLISAAIPRAALGAGVGRCNLDRDGLVCHRTSRSVEGLILIEGLVLIFILCYDVQRESLCRIGTVRFVVGRR